MSIYFTNIPASGDKTKLVFESGETPGMPLRGKVKILNTGKGPAAENPGRGGAILPEILGRWVGAGGKQIIFHYL